MSDKPLPPTELENPGITTTLLATSVMNNSLFSLCYAHVHTCVISYLCTVLQAVLERARQRREALKTRLKEATAVTAKKRTVETSDNNENVCVECGDDTTEEGTCVVERKQKSNMVKYAVCAKLAASRVCCTVANDVCFFVTFAAMH